MTILGYVAATLLALSVACIVVGWIVSLIASRDNSDMGGMFLVLGLYAGVPIGTFGLLLGSLWLILWLV